MLWPSGSKRCLGCWARFVLKAGGGGFCQGFVSLEGERVVGSGEGGVAEMGKKLGDEIVVFFRNHPPQMISKYDSSPDRNAAGPG